MNEDTKSSFFARLGTAFACFRRALADAAFCRQAENLMAPAKPVEPPKKEVLPPEKVHASGLALLAMLQREGRLVDFLQEDVAGYPDADVGAAARVVHSGCRKILTEYLTIQAVMKDSEGASVQVPSGFDARRIRLAGNITGQPPFRGTLKHHGWVATEIRLPELSDSMDPKVIAPAEVELA